MGVLVVVSVFYFVTYVEFRVGVSGKVINGEGYGFMNVGPKQTKV